MYVYMHTCIYLFELYTSTGNTCGNAARCELLQRKDANLISGGQLHNTYSGLFLTFFSITQSTSTLTFCTLHNNLEYLSLVIHMYVHTYYCWPIKKYTTKKIHTPSPANSR